MARENIVKALGDGYIASKYGFCCPDCKTSSNYTINSIHFISNSETFINFILDYTSDLISGCCINYYATETMYLDNLETLGESFEYYFPNLQITEIGDNVLITSSGNTACNNNNFYSCIQSLSGLCDDFETIFENNGFFESNTMTGKSVFCDIKDYIIDNGISSAVAKELILRFLYYGMVTFCDSKNIFIGDMAAFVKYTESVGI